MGTKAYKAAANRTKNPKQKSKLLQLSNQRRGFMEELKAEAVRLGEHVKESGGVTNMLKSAWTTLKNTVSHPTEKRAIATTISTEKAATKAYDDVLVKQEMPSYLQKMLRKQKTEIQSALQTLKGAIHKATA